MYVAQISTVLVRAELCKSFHCRNHRIKVWWTLAGACQLGADLPSCGDPLCVVLSTCRNFLLERGHGSIEPSFHGLVRVLDSFGEGIIPRYSTLVHFYNGSCI